MQHDAQTYLVPSRYQRAAEPDTHNKSFPTERLLFDHNEFKLLILVI